MDDHKIGKHCSDSTCRQRDYMPIQCKYCSTIYCSDHYSIQSHKCPQYYKQMKQVFLCPLCNKVIPINHYLSIEQNFGIHEATECSMSYEQKKEEKCALMKCKTKLYEHNLFQCKKCHEKVCLKHRIQQDHECKAIRI